MFFLLEKMKVQEFTYLEMDHLLDLFMVLYYKSSPSLRLNLIDDIDRNLFILLKQVEDRYIA